MEAVAGEVALQWVERIGGWAVVLLIVRWMMARMDRQGDHVEALIAQFSEAIKVFRDGQMEEERVHSRITEQVSNLDARLGALSEAIAAIAKKAR